MSSVTRDSMFWKSIGLLAVLGLFLVGFGLYSNGQRLSSLVYAGQISPAAKPQLVFDKLADPHFRGFSMLRSKVPGGWLLVLQDHEDEAAGLTFYPDAGHNWDGGSLEPAVDPATVESVAETGSNTSQMANPLAGCTLCHVDIEDEYVGNVHYEKKVACVKCHGPSEGHLANENNEVKPDEMFARENVDRLCSRCHKCKRPDAGQTVPEPEHKVCIDCHGPHDNSTIGEEDAVETPH